MKTLALFFLVTTLIVFLPTIRGAKFGALTARIEPRARSAGPTQVSVPGTGASGSWMVAAMVKRAGTPSATVPVVYFGAVMAGTVPAAGISHGWLATCGIGVLGAASRGMRTAVVLPPVVSVRAASVDAPQAAVPESRSTVAARSVSGIFSVIFTARAGIVWPG